MEAQSDPRGLYHYPIRSSVYGVVMDLPNLTQAPKHYTVREIFFSTQGEGNRAGTVNVFIRFAFCNLQCTPEKEGFACDTDFGHGDPMTAEEIVAAVRAADTSPDGCGWVIVTGGEPSLQLDVPLCRKLWDAGYKIAIETNGTHPIKAGVDWISVSPKPGHAACLVFADECRIVLRDKQEPTPGQLDMAGRSEYSYISPAAFAPRVEDIAGFQGTDADFSPANMAWCVEWVKKHPQFRISLQQHKVLNVR